MIETIHGESERKVLGEAKSDTGQFPRTWMDAFMVLSLAVSIQDRLSKTMEKFDDDIHRKLSGIGKRI